MNKPRNRQTIRVPMSLRVDASTFEAIETLRAISTGTSQSEVIDLWGRVYSVALTFIQAKSEIEKAAAYQELEKILS